MSQALQYHIQIERQQNGDEQNNKKKRWREREAEKNSSKWMLNVLIR